MLIVRQTQLPARVIILQGRSMPYQGVEWGGEGRSEITWYSGNPVASAQVLGPRFVPTTMEGEWKDIFLFEDDNRGILANFPALAPAARAGATERGGSTFQGGLSIPSQYAQRARVLRDAFELLRKESILLKVEWGSIVRYGFIDSTGFPHKREEDIQWRIEFSWIGETASQPKRPKPKIELLSALRALLAILDKVINTLLTFLVKAYNLKRAIEQFIRKLGSFVVALTESLQKIAAFAFAPSEILGTLKGQLTAIMLAQRDLFAAFAAGQSAAYETAIGGDLREVIMANLLQSEFRDQVLRLGADAAEKITAIDEFLAPELKGVITTKASRTLRDIAQEVYGSERNWRQLAEFNAFEGSIVPAGTVVRVPRLE